MPALRARLSFPLMLLLAATSAAHAEPPGSELLPPAKKAPPEVLPSGPALSPMYFRTSRYDAWQYYAVDRQGYWRPRVVNSPFGAYYLYNGQTFPWAEIHPLWWQPSVAGAPYDVMPYAED